MSNLPIAREHYNANISSKMFGVGRKQFTENQFERETIQRIREMTVRIELLTMPFFYLLVRLQQKL